MTNLIYSTILRYCSRASLLCKFPTVNISSQNFHLTRHSLATVKRRIPTAFITKDAKFIHNDHDLDLTDDPINSNELYKELFEQPLYVRHVLYPNSNDVLIKKLNECLTVKDTLNIIDEYEGKLTANHLTQTILVFWDLQKMFHHVNITRSLSHFDVSIFDKQNSDYVNVLFEDETFKRLLTNIESKIGDFKTKELSYIVLYLSKMGFDANNRCFKIIIEEFHRKFFKETVCLENLSRFMSGIHARKDVSFFYSFPQYVSIVLKQLDKCNSSEDFKLYTICLNAINTLLPKEFLLKYKIKVYELIISGILNPDEYKTVIKVAKLLNYPQWRLENVTVISDCLILLKGRIHLLTVHEFLSVYEIFYKNQEPGYMINEFQRCANKFLLELEEEMSPLLDIRLRLFAVTVYFSAASQRPEFEKVIRKYIDYNLDTNSMLELQKVMVFTKLTNANLNKLFWSKMLVYLDNKAFTDIHLLKICQSYASSDEITNTFRYPECENKLLELLENEVNLGTLGSVPSKFSSLAAFVLIYSRKRSLIDIIINRIAEFKSQFNSVDCLNISESLATARNENVILTKNDFRRIKDSLDFNTSRIIKSRESLNANDTSLLFKAALCRGSMRNKEFHTLWDKCNTELNLSSKLLKSISYCLYTSGVLLPNLVNSLTEYIIRHQNKVLGFNVERVLHMCFYLGYAPTNSKKFFDAATDIILRDQERMTGLSYIQACLSLAFFNVLPRSFIKQIFNVEFLEKLDVELENCYYKDVYPVRIRDNMMYLNRSVCLDYPEANVPWFHQKHAIDMNNKEAKKKECDPWHLQFVQNYLHQLTPNSEEIHCDVLLPYGYNIDFLIHLDNKKKITSLEKSSQKVAVLVMRSSAYTKGQVQLKGKHQMKVRHIEMLGYKVAVLNYNKWKSLMYARDKIDYLKEILGMKMYEVSPDVLIKR